MKVGLIGLGRMGTAMARRVLAAGHDLLVYNRTPQKAADLVKAGARAAASISAACADREVLITMVADDSALQEAPLVGALLVGPGTNARILFAGAGPEALVQLLPSAASKYFGKECLSR